MGRLLALAVRVDLLCECGDAFAQYGGQACLFVGEGEGFEIAGFVITNIGAVHANRAAVRPRLCCL